MFQIQCFFSNSMNFLANSTNFFKIDELFSKHKSTYYSQLVYLLTLANWFFSLRK